MSTNGSVLVNQALEAFKARDRVRAADLLNQVVQMNPPLGASWGSIARLAETLGEVSLAVTAAQRHAALNPADPLPQLRLGQTLAQNGRHQEALALGETLAVAQSNNPAVWHFIGTCRAQLGDDVGAVRDLRRATALFGVDPNAAWSWMTLAGAKRFEADDPDIAAMQTLLAALGATPSAVEAASTLAYALGKAYDDVGLVDRAFAAYSAGAAGAKAARKATADNEGFINSVTSQFDESMLARLPRGIDTTRPVFVHGLPRSGTTLVEQILVSHDQVSDGAEVNLFRTAAMPIGGFTPEAITSFAVAHPDGFADIGRDYLHLLEERFGSKGRVVDKTLNHSGYMGLLHAVLPNARIIWMRRDPGAVAWSCFRTRFAGGVEWSWSLEDIARHFREEDRLREHWERVLGDAILTVPYEELVSNPDAWIPRILAHVGLPWQDGLKDFHKTERAVATASVSQVRQPIYTSSREAWRKYETHLKPFFDAYQAG